MTARDDFDRHITAWLAADAPTREPEPLLDQVLARTARTRRRPAWLIPERWIHMSTITNRLATTSRVPLRPLAVAALLIITLIVSALVIAGTRRESLPAPFGPAANGQLSYSVDGDIIALDSLTGAPRTIIGGPTQDWGPLYAATGSRLAFIRGVDGDRALWVANADGSEQRRLAGPFATIPGWVEWSPQGDAIAMTLEEDPSLIQMVRADGSGVSVIDTGLKTVINPIFRPSDGAQLTFRGEAVGGTMGIYLMDRSGANLHRLDLDPGFESDDYYVENSPYYFNAPVWSADGRTLLYHTLEPSPNSSAGPGFRIHQATIGLDGRVETERILEFDPAIDDEFEPSFLPNGEAMLFQTIEGNDHKLWIVPMTPGAEPRDLGVQATDWIGRVQSPDGTQVIAVIAPAGSGPTIRRVDLTSGATAPLSVGDDLSWQRLALPQ